MRRHREQAMAKWLSLLIALVCLTDVKSAPAQSFPSRQVTIFVTATPGGVTDVVARAIGQRLSERWGKPVVIENRGGGGRNVAGGIVAKAAPDGHTLLITEAGLLVINPALYGKDKLSYDAEKDLIPITGLIRINQALVVNPSLPAASMRELLDLAKRKPGAITYATAGVGSAPHLNVALLEHLAGVQFVPVHYRGATLAMNDVIAGHVNMMTISISLALGPTQAGHLKMLGIGGRKRLPLFPDVPTLAEATGFPAYDAGTWFGLLAPAGTPRETVMQINAEVAKVLADPAFRERFLDPQMFEPITSSPEEFAEYIRAESQKWSALIRDAKLSIE
jgi:tripartite-type tricarboxylate transporter receptor subunit TctC